MAAATLALPGVAALGGDGGDGGDGGADGVGPMMVTPHAGETAALLGVARGEALGQRLSAVRP